MTEQQALLLCSFQGYCLLICILCLGTLQRYRGESSKDTQIAPTTSMALARSSQGCGSCCSHRVYSLGSLSTDPLNTASRDKGSGHIFAMTLLCFQSRPQRVLSSTSCPWPRIQPRLTGPTHWKDAINLSGKFLRTTAPGLLSPTATAQSRLATHAEPSTSEQLMFNCMACEISAAPGHALLRPLLHTPWPLLPLLLTSFCTLLLGDM